MIGGGGRWTVKREEIKAFFTSTTIFKLAHITTLPHRFSFTQFLQLSQLLPFSYSFFLLRFDCCFTISSPVLSSSEAIVKLDVTIFISLDIERQNKKKKKSWFLHKKWTLENHKKLYELEEWNEFDLKLGNSFCFCFPADIFEHEFRDV